MTETIGAAGATIVSSSDELHAALSQARDGDTILLSPNKAGYRLDYYGGDAARMENGAGVVVASLDPERPARFEALKVVDGDNLTFRDLVFEATDHFDQLIAVALYHSDNLAIADSQFRGEADGYLSSKGAFAGKALVAEGMTDLSLTGNTIEKFTYGLNIHESRDTVISDNEILHIQGDGMRFTGVDGLVIADNLLADFYAASSRRIHSDFIQFWTRNTTSQTKNVTIEDNVMIASGNKPTQMIFMNNERVAKFGYKKSDYLFQNVNITDNVLINDAKNTIYVYGADDVDISRNYVFNKLNPDDIKNFSEPWIRVLSYTSDVNLEDNVAPKINLGTVKGLYNEGNRKLSYRDADSRDDYYKELLSVASRVDEAHLTRALVTAGLLDEAPSIPRPPSAPTTPPPAPADATEQGPFPGSEAPRLGADGLVIDASNYDQGGGGVAYLDAPGLQGGVSGDRDDGDVEHTAAGDIGWIEAGESLEYTIFVETAGVYELRLSPVDGARDSAARAFFLRSDSDESYFASPAIGTGGDGADAVVAVTLEAGPQVLRLEFEGGRQGLRSFSLAPEEAPEDAPPAAEAGRIGHAGSLQLDQAGPDDWHRVTFDSPLDDPAVVVGPLTANDEAPATVRVRNVTDAGFEVQIDEWDYLDGRHGTETLSWVAIEKGRHVLPTGLFLEAGVSVSAGGGADVEFDAPFNERPVVFGQIASATDGSAAALRLFNVDERGFDFLVQEEEAADDAHGPERIDWIAIEGPSAQGATVGLATSVKHFGETLDVGAPAMLEDRAFLAAMQTMVGSDPATVRIRAEDGSAVRVFIEEERSAGGEMRHAGEAVGWLSLSDDLLAF